MDISAMKKISTYMRYMLIKFTHTIIKKEKKTCTTGHLLVIITLSDIHNIIILINIDEVQAFVSW